MTRISLVSLAIVVFLALSFVPPSALATSPPAKAKSGRKRSAPTPLPDPPPAPTALPESGLDAAVPGSVWLERFENGAGKKAEDFGWKGGQDKDGKFDHSLVTENGRTFLREDYLVGTEALHLYKEVDWDISQYPYLRWRWRANKLPKGAKVTESRVSDAAAQLYILWEVGRRKRVMKYFWGVTDKVGDVLDQSNVVFGKLHGEILRAGGPTGLWVTEVRNVAEDYKRAFGEAPPAQVRGIAVLSDGDETKSESSADFADIEILKTPPAAMLQAAPPVKLTQ